MRPVAAELSHADRQTDRHDEANRFFSKFCQRHLQMMSIHISETD